MLASAYDALIDGIYYNLNYSAKTAEVTYANQYSANYSGNVTIPSTVTYNGLTYSVTSIGDDAFCYCTGLTEITIPNSVTLIGDFAFNWCTGLTEIIIPNSVTSIGSIAFQKCSGLTSVTIPNSVTSIGYCAFSDCSGLTSVTIPNSITEIEYGTFYNCSGLTSVTIPNSITSIGSYAFDGCTGLTEVHISDIAAWCNISFVDSESNPLYYAHHLYLNDEKITNLVILKDVTEIKNYAFYNCSDLASITFGNSVTTIGSSAFVGTDLKKTIWLTNTPPSGYTYAAGEVNYVSNDNYSSLSNVVKYPFLSSIFEVDGVKYVPVSPSERTCDAIDCSYDNTTDIVIDNTVTYKGVKLNVQNIQPYTFYGNTNIESLTCNNSGYIGNYAFSGCSSMNETTIGSGVSTINNYAFQNCTSLPEIIIPENVTSIDNYVFSGCKSLKNVIIEDRDSELLLGSNGADPMFADCPLNSVYIGGNITYKTSAEYGYSPFFSNKFLRTVVITNKETEISGNEFYGCTNLENFTIGDGVTSFGNYAFSGCTSLLSLSFGSQLTSIGEEAFSDCNSVTKISSRATTPPTCGTQALDDISKWSCTLYVPKGYISAYQSADQWKEFFFIEEKEDVTPGDANGDGKVSIADVTTVASYLLGDTPEGFNAIGADANEDGKVSIADVTTIASKLLEK